METENKTALEKKENPFVSIIFNIVIPVLILSKFAKITAKFFPDQTISPVCGLLIALAFPTLYFLYDYFTRHKTNFISIIGFVSILLTGIIGVFEFPSEWIAYKEASVPFIIGLAILISLKTPYPLVRKLLYNKELIDVEKVDGILEEKNATEKFDKILVNSTYMLALSFLVSTILNFTLAKILIHSPSGTEEFNQELARMTGLSYPVIALPSTLVMMLALWYLIHNVKKITGLTMEEMLAPQLRNKMSEMDKKEEEKKSIEENDAQGTNDVSNE
ncbi:MAG: hypothetical protein J6Y78_02775 [Paludibacteraceae bacterium]|nr:hypothetical protein [Paludibacteraceae bacterium]MEE3485000.1 VC0807 family protein [Bacteroidales bacterium]